MKLLIKDIGRLVSMDPSVGTIDDAAIVIKGDRIDWVGKSKELPFGDYDEISAKNGLVLPGLIDCHTHLVHAGSRENEFAMRSEGKTYQQIAAAGGGILSTVKATRLSTQKQLVDLAAKRLSEAKSFGTTCLEIKSGYGLDAENEMKMLSAIQELSSLGSTIVGTFLGAHVVPSEHKANRKEYVKNVIEMLPEAKKFSACRFADVFVEEGAFSADEAKVIAKAAKELGFGIKLHVDQFTDQGGAKLASEFGAISADHLDFSSDDGLKAMAKAGVAGVLLPGASIFTGHKCPDARRMIDLKVNVAIASDYNPGTCPALNLVLMAGLGVTQMGMTIDEAWRSVTVNAARALCMDDRGSVSPGRVADLVAFEAPNEAFPLYRFSTNLVIWTLCKGRLC